MSEQGKRQLEFVAAREAARAAARESMRAREAVDAAVEAAFLKPSQPQREAISEAARTYDVAYAAAQAAYAAAHDAFLAADAARRADANAARKCVEVMEAGAAPPTKPSEAPPAADVVRQALTEEEQRLEKRLVPLAHCRTALDIVGDIAPPRINEEEIGDALERLHMLVASDKPIWRLYLKTAASIWWILLHVLLHYLQRAAGIVQVAMGKGNEK